MKKSAFTFLLVLALLAPLCQGLCEGEMVADGGKKVTEINTPKPENDLEYAAFASETQVALPKGVTKISLEEILGRDASDITDVWLINENICVLLRYLGEGGLYPINDELIVLDAGSGSVLSRTLIPDVDYLSKTDWEDGLLHLKFVQIHYDEETYSEDYYDVKITLDLNGTVSNIIAIPREPVLMADGQIEIHHSNDGSLYAVDVATGEEKILLQGVSDNGLYTVSYEDAIKYVPFWDEIEPGEEEWDGKDYDYSCSDFFPSPLLECDYDPNDFIMDAFREFYVYKPLDEYRFVYTVSGWEYSAGFGIYDLETYTDHRITGRGALFGLAGNTLFGAMIKADVNTYETFYYPESVKEQLFEVSLNRWIQDYPAYCDISPDGKWLVLTGMKTRHRNTDYDVPTFGDVSTASVTNIETGKIVKSYNIDDPYLWEWDLSFYDDTHFMLLCQSEEGYPIIYLFDIEE